MTAAPESPYTSMRTSEPGHSAVLAVTDAVIVGQLCGIALVIARFSESAHKEIDIAASRLRQNGVNVRGSILNAVEKRASSYYGYGGYYGYGYGYKYQSKDNA